MERENWNKCQLLAEIGQINLVADLLVKEIQDNLTDEQLSKLGDINSFIIDTFSKKQTFTVEQFVKQIVAMSKDGAIIGPVKKV